MRRGRHQLPRGFPTRLQLLVGFSVLVAIFVAALAVGLGRLLRDSIRDAALSGAEQTGQLFAELELGREEYKGRKLAATAPRDLDVVVETSASLRVARLWGRHRELVYSSDRGRPGRPSPDPGALRTAFSGEIESRAPSADSSERPLKIYVPISLAGDRRPRNVLELHLPYEPVQATIDHRTKSMAIVLVAGALLFYLALFPTVLRGSSALADLYEARRVPLQRRLRRAIGNGELALDYQPKLDLQTERIEGVEALLRWRLEDGSVVPPAEYIPLVEPTPVMEELTMHVFELAVRQSAAWAEQGIDLDIAVNISACNLCEEDLPNRLSRLTAAHGRSPARFTLEVTESAMSRRPDRDLHTLVRLRACGFKLSVDDFGAGESSLSRVRAIDVQEVKIDRSFVRHLDEQGDPVLMAGIIDLAHSLGATVVAEGVESEAAARQLTALGCDALQGFHLARPMPPGELAEWLRDRPSNAVVLESQSPAADAAMA
ncbi:MAG: EAL domain-containing protein [Actinomycetota bacterium]